MFKEEKRDFCFSAEQKIFRIWCVLTKKKKKSCVYFAAFHRTIKSYLHIESIMCSNLC